MTSCRNKSHNFTKGTYKMLDAATTGTSAMAGNEQPQNGQPTGQPAAAPAEGAGTTSLFAPEYANNPSIQKFGGDVDKLAKSYLSLESLMGQGRVAVPKDDADANAWSLYDKAFGVPDKADGYKLTAPDGANLSEFNELMRKNHISPKVAQELLDAHLGEFQHVEELKSQQAQKDMQDAEDSLKKEWGMKYAENMSSAAKFLQKVSETQEDYAYFESKIGNDPKFIKLLARMGNQISEGSLGGFEGQVSGFTKTPIEAKNELNSILNDPDDAYFAGVRNKRNDPRWCKEHNAHFVPEQERKARVAYVQSLMQMQGQS